MSPRCLPFVAALAVVASALPAAAQEPPSDYVTGPEGHTFRVRFDPASRVSLSAGEALGAATGKDPSGSVELGLGVSYRARYSAGRGEERIDWQVDHRVLQGRIEPQRRAGALPVGEAELYRLSALRHDESPSLTLPVSPPVSVAFPFDLGFELAFGRVSIRPEPGADARIHADVARAGFVLDPWRSGQSGKSLELGAGLLYEIDARKQPGGAEVVHRIAPLTATSLRLRWQSDDGLAAASLRAEAIPHWTSERTWQLEGRGEAHLERTLLAIADQPVAAVLEGSYRTDGPLGARDRTEDVRLSLGIACNFELR